MDALDSVVFMLIYWRAHKSIRGHKCRCARITRTVKTKNEIKKRKKKKQCVVAEKQQGKPLLEVKRAASHHAPLSEKDCSPREY